MAGMEGEEESCEPDAGLEDLLAGGESPRWMRHGQTGVVGMSYSPELAIATAVFEIGAAWWVLRRRGDRDILRLAGGILLLLATYQLLEAMICMDEAGAGFLPRLAFIAVTWLPPLGLMLIAKLRQPRSTVTTAAARAMLGAAGVMVIWIAADSGFATISVCTAVVARYTHAMPRFLFYSAFYWVGLAGMVGFSAYGLKKTEAAPRRRLIGQVFAGTLAFVVPSLITSFFVPMAKGAMPSVMCHYALLLAIFLTRMAYLEHRATDAVAERTEDEGLASLS